MTGLIAGAANARRLLMQGYVVNASNPWFRMVSCGAKYRSCLAGYFYEPGEIDYAFIHKQSWRHGLFVRQARCSRAGNQDGLLVVPGRLAGAMKLIGNLAIIGHYTIATDDNQDYQEQSGAK